MNTKHNACLLAAILCLFVAQAQALEAGPAIPGARIDFTPLPLQLYLLPGQKPVAAFTTPCVQIEKATPGFPPFMAFEHFMFELIGKVNDSGVLPLRLEPVCI